MCSFHANNNDTDTLSSPATVNNPPSYSSHDQLHKEVLDPPFLKTIDSTIDSLTDDLRKLSIFIWEHPELGFKEVQAHNELTSFMKKSGFNVTPHHLGLETAWRAEFSHGENGRVIGLQSEMDALPGLGHACGHNLIAITGVAVAVALKAALVEHDIPGKIILLGTPAEEFGGGKIELLNKGAYDEMDVCLMAHPGPGALNGTVVQPWIAIQNLEVEFTGHPAHAAYAPWEGQNALDAAFLAYSAISALRQQIKPTERVHGVLAGKDWETNVIPDYAKMKWAIRATSWEGLVALRTRVNACFEGAAHATSCKVDIKEGVVYKDCRQNDVLAREYLRIAQNNYGMGAVSTDTSLQASTDLVSSLIPTIQPVFHVPTVKGGSNHTEAFKDSAGTQEAHDAAIKTSKVLACTALRVLTDNGVWEDVRSL
ncbi:hypothetical protein BDW22DRAFT_1336005 [Trametopsis cervina]|nr:hypothetical protein BDW22DRAFT_1336005 [Trametopsis cervina]